MGIQQMLLGSKVGIASPPPGWGAFYDINAFHPAELTFDFSPSGEVVVRRSYHPFFSNILISTRWYTPVTTGIGANYWWRATHVSGANPPYSAVLQSNVTRGGTNPLGTWFQLNTFRTISFGADGTKNAGDDGEHVVEIATDAAGTNIVATWPIIWSIETAI